MRRMMLGAAAALALVWPGVSVAQVPTQDSVVLSRGPGGAVAGEFTLVTLDASSGPSGEHPAGQATFVVFPIPFDFLVSGPVTCLAVSGSTATMNVQDSFRGVVTVQVVDNQPDQFDALPVGRAPTDCSPLPPSGFGGPVSGGDIIVVDAPALPTSKDQCKSGGWKTYGVFKNQGDCVSFVVHRAVRACVFEREAHGRRAFREKYGKGRFDPFAFLSCVKQRVDA